MSFLFSKSEDWVVVPFLISSWSSREVDASGRISVDEEADGQSATGVMLTADVVLEEPQSERGLPVGWFVGTVSITPSVKYNKH